MPTNQREINEQAVVSLLLAVVACYWAVCLAGPESEWEARLNRGLGLPRHILFARTGWVLVAAASGVSVAVAARALRQMRPDRSRWRGHGAAVAGIGLAVAAVLLYVA